MVLVDCLSDLIERDSHSRVDELDSNPQVIKVCFKQIYGFFGIFIFPNIFNYKKVRGPPAVWVEMDANGRRFDWRILSRHSWEDFSRLDRTVKQ